MSESVNELMEQASAALVKMDYAGSERLSLRALEICQAQHDWITFARVLMPLQEARRQRRLTACDGGVVVGGLDAAPAPGQAAVWVARGVTREQAAGIDRDARARGDAVEVLWVSEQTDAAWTVASFAGPELSVQLPAPATVDAAWYLLASEALGDRAIAGCEKPLGGVDRVADLMDRLPAVLDHEKLHQALAEAARRAGPA